MYSLYGSWTIEETKSVGECFKAICTGSRGMERHLTSGRVYEITISPRILPLTPLCSFIGDEGKKCECHLERFEKVNNTNM